MTRSTNPEPVDVCIIGAGASGAAAAKVLTEGGLRVVALEKGPWRTKESFGGDELVSFAEGESIFTESSYKYACADFARLARKAGFSTRQVWTDADAKFCVGSKGPHRDAPGQPVRANRVVRRRRAGELRRR